MAALSILLLGQLLGARGVAAAVVGSMLWLAWRHDNRTGACFPLVTLFLLAVGTILLLFYLVLVTHPR